MKTAREQRQELFDIHPDQQVLLGKVEMTAEQARRKLFEIVKQDEPSPWDLFLVEDDYVCGPDGTIRNDEWEELATVRMLQEFESDINHAIEKATTRAQEIGGDFRTPGLKKAIRDLMDNMRANV